MDAPRVLNLTRLGWGLAVPVIFLTGLGLASIHATERGPTPAAAAADASTSLATRPAVAETPWLRRAYQAIGPLTVRQTLFLITGVGLMLLTLLPSYRRIGEFSYLIYGLLILALLLLVIDWYVQPYFDLPFTPERRNTRRWLSWGPVSLQPSEFVKIGLILALARYLRFRDSYRTWRGLLPPFLMTLLPMALILKQPDLGTVLMLLPVLFAMLFVAGARLRHMLPILTCGAAVFAGSYAAGAYADRHDLPPGHALRWVGMKAYQRQRIQAVFRQNTLEERWHMDQGYQLRQGLIALGTGGVLGQGYGRGAFVQYELLPEEHNDFIFAIIGNQWGLVGCLLVILAYAVIIVCGLEVALVTNDPFGRLLAVGVVVMIAVQALMNMCMTIGLAPITGITLPFVSAGGSSLWANFIALGLLLNVAQRRPLLIANPPFEFAE